MSDPTLRIADATPTVAYQTSSRKVYQNSVIPGGVYSGQELARARRTDPVVSAHYSDFGENARVTKLNEDQLVYISYRKANKVYWSKKKHLVCKGEAVVTDGKNVARSRCGNRLSKTPKLPTVKNEPTETALNSPETPKGVPDAHTGGGPVDANNLGGPGFDPGTGVAPNSLANTGAGNDGGSSPTNTGANKGLPPPVGFYPNNSPYYAAGPLLASGPRTSGSGGTGGTGTGATGTGTPGGGTTGTGTSSGGTGGGTTGTGTTGGGTPTTPITTITPEPASLVLMLVGGGLAYWARRRRSA